MLTLEGFVWMLGSVMFGKVALHLKDLVTNVALMLSLTWDSFLVANSMHCQGSFRCIYHGGLFPGS